MEEDSEGQATSRSTQTLELDGLSCLMDPDPIRERRALGGVLSRMFGEPSEPTCVGRYLIDRCLGAGSMGVVYLGYDPKLTRHVAIKVMRPAGASPSCARADERLEREARALARVRHPNVVEIHDVGRHGDGVFVVMEYIEGDDLEGWLQAVSPPSWRDVLDIMLRAGRGLQAAHEADIVHRDFKPTNVLIDDKGRVKVTDFGLARTRDEAVTEQDDDPGDHVLPQLTMEGALVGTPSFMAPELLRGQPADAASDQFAFSVALWRALFGVLPFSASTLAELREAMESGSAVRPANGRVPRWLYRVVRRGMAPDPSHRFASMRAMLNALERQRRPRRALVGGGLVVGGGIAVMSLAPLEQEPAAMRCDADSAALVARWNPERRRALREHLMQGSESSSDGEAMWSAFAERADTFVEQWRRAGVALCEQRRGGTEPEELQGLRGSCLAWQRHLVHAQLDALEHSSPEWMPALVSTELPDPGVCLKGQAVRHAMPLPTGPDAVRDAARVKLCTTRVAALRPAHEANRAKELLAECERLAATLDHPPSHAAIARERGRLAVDALDIASARAHLERAYELAQRGHDAEGAYAALILRTRLEGQLALDEQRTRGAYESAKAMEPLLGRGQDRAWAALRASMGAALLHLGHWEEGLERLQQAYDALLVVDGAVPVHTALVLVQALAASGRLDRAELILDEVDRDSRAQTEEPSVAVDLLFARASVELNRGTVAGKQAAVELHSKRLAWLDELDDATVHDRVASLANRGAAYMDLGDLELAEASIVSALELVRRHATMRTTNVVPLELNLSIIAKHHDRRSQAIAHAKSAISHSSELPEYESLGRAQLSGLLLDDGRLARARTEAELAVSVGRDATARFRLDATLALLRVRLAERRFPEVVELARDHLRALGSSAVTYDVRRRARLHLDLAQALAQDPATIAAAVVEAQRVNELLARAHGLRGVAELEADAAEILQREGARIE